MTEIVGKEMLLFRCAPGRENENVLCMDLPFVIFIPYGRGPEESSRRVPPASIQLPSRTAETFYELVVTVQQGHSEQRKYPFPVPLSRYDTLSTFGMYNRPESKEQVSDHLVSLGISLPRWSYGPLDPVSVYIKLSPNPDWPSKARKVTIQKISISIDEEIVYNPEGDEPTRKVKTIAKQSQAVGVKMPEAGYFTNLGLVFPSKDVRDAEGVLPRGKRDFPMYGVSGFTTSGSLYRIEYFLTVKVSNLHTSLRPFIIRPLTTCTLQASMSAAKDVICRQPIVVCPLDHAGCKQEMEAIAQAAKDAAEIDPNDPMLPAPWIVRSTEPGGMRYLGVAMVAGHRKPLIE